MKLYLSPTFPHTLMSLYRPKTLVFKLKCQLPGWCTGLARNFFSAWVSGVFAMSLIYGSVALGQSDTVSAPPQTLVLGFHEVPPFVYRDSQGRPAGELMDFQIKIIEDAGFQWVARTYPGKRLHHALHNGTVNIYLGPALRDEFREKVLVSDFVITFINMRLYSLNDSPPIHSLEELTDQRMVIVRGYSYGGWASHFKSPKSRLKITEVSDHIQGMKMLKSRRASYFLGYDKAGYEALEKLSEKNIKYNTVMNTPMHTIISKKTPNAHKVMSRLRDAYDATSPNERPGFEPIGEETE